MLECRVEGVICILPIHISVQLEYVVPCLTVHALWKAMFGNLRNVQRTINWR